MKQREQKVGLEVLMEKLQQKKAGCTVAAGNLHCLGFFCLEKAKGGWIVNVREFLLINQSMDPFGIGRVGGGDLQKKWRGGFCGAQMTDYMKQIT